jgi:hypothetical protein
MIVCELCVNYERDGECRLGLKIPKGMSCRDYDPGLERFCANPSDFVSAGQVVQMATFFGMKGTELKKVKVMASREENERAEPSAKSTTLIGGSEFGRNPFS